MQHLIRVMITTTMLCGVTACGDADREPPPVEDTVFGDMVETKQRAKDGVDQAMETHKQQMEEAMKKQESGE
jgi:hypothetical protein